jgi:MYXO-CTERM domain-containing protein
VVSDGQLVSAPATVEVPVANVNRPPTASAGADFTAGERELVVLGAEASDPDDGAVLTYAWVQTAGPAVTLSSDAVPGPTFTAPEVTAPIELGFEVTVSDGDLTAVASVTVTVVDVNRPPVASAGPAQVVASGAAVTLDGRASSDPDGDAPLTYGWFQTAGPPVAISGAPTATPTFTAPAGPATLTFQVFVGDGAASASASTTVTVEAAPSSGGGGGCGCSSGGGDPAALVPFLLGLGLLPRRRRRAA